MTATTSRTFRGDHFIHVLTQLAETSCATFSNRYFIQAFYSLGIPMYYLIRSFRREPPVGTALIDGDETLLNEEQLDERMESPTLVDEEADKDFPELLSDSFPSYGNVERGSVESSRDDNHGFAYIGSPEIPLFSTQCLWVATGLMTLCFFSGWLWYLSLPLTEVAANTTIYQCAAVFVYLLSIPLVGEKITFQKVSAVIVSLSGVGLIAFSSKNGSSVHKDDTNTAKGILLVFATTICYSIYEVLVKCVGPQESSPTVVEDSCFLFGLFGIMTIVCFWPGLLILDFTGIEPFEWPSVHILQLFVLNGLMDAVFNVMLVIGIAFTTPLFITCGTMLAIPGMPLYSMHLLDDITSKSHVALSLLGSIIWDYCAHGSELDEMALMGVLVVVAGFVLLNFNLQPKETTVGLRA